MFNCRDSSLTRPRYDLYKCDVYLRSAGSNREWTRSRGFPLLPFFLSVFSLFLFYFFFAFIFSLVSYARRHINKTLIRPGLLFVSVSTLRGRPALLQFASPFSFAHSRSQLVEDKSLILGISASFLIRLLLRSLGFSLLYRSPSAENVRRSINRGRGSVQKENKR